MRTEPLAVPPMCVPMDGPWDGCMRLIAQPLLCSWFEQRSVLCYLQVHAEATVRCIGLPTAYVQEHPKLCYRCNMQPVRATQSPIWRASAGWNTAHDGYVQGGVRSQDRWGAMVHKTVAAFHSSARTSVTCNSGLSRDLHGWVTHPQVCVEVTSSYVKVPVRTASCTREGAWCRTFPFRNAEFTRSFAENRYELCCAPPRALCSGGGCLNCHGRGPVPVLHFARSRKLSNRCAHHLSEAGYSLLACPRPSCMGCSRLRYAPSASLSPQRLNGWTPLARMRCTTTHRWSGSRRWA